MTPHSNRKRRGFSLMELMLALGLTVLVASLIGYLMQLYLAISESGDQRIKQAQLARQVLSTMADDIRSVVRVQPFDGQALEQILSGSSGGGSGQGGMGGASGGGSSGGGTGGGSTGSGSTTGGGSFPSGGGSSTPNPSTGGSASGGISGGAGQGNGGMQSSSSMSGAGGGASGSASGSQTSTTTVIPPGIYGTSTSLQVDVSRLPRPDQYFAEQPDMLTGRLTDVPSDTKTVTYTIQAPTLTGVQDPLGSTNGQNMNGGLVRRQIDRSISQWAELNGKTESLNRTGEILSPEVLEIGYSYYDGTTWVSSWDSSQQGLPWVVEITIAMQDPVIAKKEPIQPGQSVTNMDSATRAQLGIETYSVTVAIPGAQLLTSPQPASSAGTGSTSNGMSSLGF